MQALHAGIAEQVWIFEVLDLKTSEAEVQKRMRNRKKKWKISSLNKNRNKLMIIVLGERKEPWRKLALRDLQFAELSLKIRARSVQSSDKKFLPGSQWFANHLKIAWCESSGRALQVPLLSGSGSTLSPTNELPLKTLSSLKIHYSY